MPRTVAPLTLLLLSLLSGASALIYQTVWLRWFRLLFGNTAYAASATLCAFFAGLALGAVLFGRWAGRTRRPLRIYAGIEFAVAATALLVPFAVDAYGSIYSGLYESFANHRIAFVGLKFSLALVAMIPTATLLGGTFPMLAVAFVGDSSDMGRRSSLLYAVNTLGAAIGSAAGALWLPEQVGVPATYMVAVALSLVVGLWALASERSRAPVEPEPAATKSHVLERASRSLLLVAFVSGLGTLAFEVLLIHAIALVLMSSIYSFGAVLIVVLLALAGGAAIAAVGIRRVPARSLLPAALVIEAVALLALPWWIHTGSGGLNSWVPGTFGNGLWLAAKFGGLPFLVAGLVLPLTFRLAKGGAVGPRIGGLLAFNTVGAITGSVLASFVLLDHVGLWPSIAALGLCYGSAALICAGSPRARALRAGVIAVAAVAVFTTANPFQIPLVKLAANEHLLAIDEGAHGIVSVTDFVTDDFETDRYLKVNNQYILSGALARKHQQRMGHLPLLLRPGARSVVYVGSATGETASAATMHPVEEIVLLEIVPEVQELAAKWFDEFNLGVYRDPRTRLVVEDGRNHMRGTPEQYDAVVADLFVPHHPGVGAMYSREHFEAVKQRLVPGGVFCQWLPIYQLRAEEFLIIVATFLEVFPDATLWRGDFFVHNPTAALVGIVGESAAVAEIDAAAKRLRERGVDDRWITDPGALWMFYLGRLEGLLDLANVPRNSDGWPVFEYVAARTTNPQRVTFRRQWWPDIWRRAADVASAEDPIFPGRPFDRMLGGRAMASAGLMVAVEGDRKIPEAASLLRANVPAELLEHPDKTVSEFWPTAAENP